MIDTSTPTAVYRFFDATDQLLYVGITDAPATRWKWHAKKSAWWTLAHRRELAWYDDREDAAEEEQRAIAAEKPIHNKAGKRKNAAGGTIEDRVTLRHDHDEWKAFDAVVKSLGFRSRNAYLSNVIDWVLHKPNARAPRRRPRPTDA